VFSQRRNHVRSILILSLSGFEKLPIKGANIMRVQSPKAQPFAVNFLKQIIHFFLSLTLILGAFKFETSVQAGTPLAVTAHGKEVSWGAGATITYNVDQGPLGTLTNAQAVTMVNELFGIWQAVPGANLTIQNGGALNVDVNASNYTTYRANTNADAYHPIIFDTDGSITDSVFGAGASTVTAGFAGPGWLISTDPAQDGKIVDASAVLNAKFLSSGYGTLTEFKAIVLHELGHFLGVGHSQANLGLAFDREAIFNNNDSLPIMFPISLGDRSSILSADDKAQLLRLYPGGATTNGTISGKVLLADGVNPFQGANVIARRVDDPNNIAVSSVSGFYYKGTGVNASKGTTDATVQGYYEISGLPAGNYTVEIEPIHPGFISGSSVGPLDPPVDLPGPAEYYSGASESNSDANNSAAIVSVNSGQTVSNINIILNNNPFPNAAETEANNTIATAQTIAFPVVVSGAINFNDAGTTDPTTGYAMKDHYSFSGNANDWVTFDLNWGSSAAADLKLILYDAAGTRIAISMDCVYSGSICVPSRQIGPMKLPTTGSYTVGVGSGSGSTNYTLQVTGQRNNNGSAVTVSAASYQGGAALSPDTIASMFGTNMSASTVIATPGQPLPTSMNGVRVEVAGVPAQLFYVSPSQINYVIPSSTTSGTKLVVVKNSAGEVARGTIEVAPVAPAFFTANQNGAGVPAGYVTRVAAGTFQQTNQVIATYNGSSYTPATVARNGDSLYLILFGTGVRYAPNSNAANDIPQAGGSPLLNVSESVEVTIGGVVAQVAYAGVQGAYIGLDQLNILIPANAVASPTTPVIIKVRNANNNMVTANQMTIALQ
jgi:uncharacterized protein (TIGR03437 family)